MRLFKRSAVLINTALFGLFSPAFLHVIDSLSRGVSSLDIASLKHFYFSQPILMGLTLFVFVGLYSAWRFAGYLFFAYVLYIFSLSFLPFLQNFDKLLLFFDFFYLIIGFYLFILWRLEINDAVYLPGFNKRDMGPKSEYNLPVTVKSLKTGREFRGVLTNWDTKSLFFVPNSENLKLKGRVTMKMEFLGQSFLTEGTIVTGYGGGFGIRLMEAPKHKKREKHTSLGWAEYYDIISSRGYKPRMI